MKLDSAKWCRWGVVLGLLLATPTVWANGATSTREAVRASAESSLLVKGQIEILPDGSVAGITIDHEEVLQKEIRDFLRNTAAQWKFEPVLVDGQARRAKAPMSVRLVAKKAPGDDNNYQISIAGASFNEYRPNDPSSLSPVRRTAPSYPEEAYRSGVSGIVYLLIKVDRDGNADDVVAEQVNLRGYASEPMMRRFRNVLERNAISAVRHWTYRIPSEGPAANQQFWVVRVPVNYAITESGKEVDKEYGRWETYVPGPRAKAPWNQQEDAAGFSPDALPDGGVYLAGANTGPKLLTPLSGS